MSLENLKKKNEKDNACKSTKAERYRKFNRFKDLLHKEFGPPKSNGIGEGSKIVCDFCKQVLLWKIYGILRKRGNTF